MLKSILYVIWISIILLAPINHSTSILICSMSFVIVWIFGAMSLFSRYHNSSFRLIFYSAALLFPINVLSIFNIIFDLEFNKFISVFLISISNWIILSKFRIIAGDIPD